MDITVEHIFMTVFFLAMITLGVMLFRQMKLTKNLQARLDELIGKRDNGMFGKGKFSELGLMSAGIAHEISNPLTIIQGRLVQLQRIYRDSTKQKEVAQGLQQIHYTSDRIAKIIQGLRAYIYRDDQQFESFIPLSEILENVLIFCGQRLKNHGIELRLVNIEKVHVNGHRGQLEQAILNLINNSFDAIDNLQEKWIEISAVEVGETIDIYFKDSGHGIPVDIRKKMLEPFFTTKDAKGTGLGLPLVKGIAEKHGGDLLYVENSENTTFLLELPKARLSLLGH